MATSLAILRAKVRRYIKESTADRWTDADLNAFINEGIVFVQGEIESANPEWFLRIETFTASAGSYQAALPADIWGNRLRSVQAYPNATTPAGVGYRVPPGQLEWILENIYYSASTPDNYSMLAGYIRWAPLLSYNSCFRYVYALKETPLTADSDNMGRISDEHADLVAIYASIIAISVVNGNTASLENRLTRGLMKMRSDVVPSDPLTIPQVQID
jgi:hypothetical protein